MQVGLVIYRCSTRSLIPFKEAIIADTKPLELIVLNYKQVGGHGLKMGWTVSAQNLLRRYTYVVIKSSGLICDPYRSLVYHTFFNRACNLQLYNARLNVFHIELYVPLPTPLIDLNDI